VPEQHRRAGHVVHRAVAEAHRLHDARHGQGVALAADPRHQAAEHAEGDRQRDDEAGAGAALRAHLDGAAEVLDDGLDHVETDAAPGGLGDLRARGEAGCEEQAQQLLAGDDGVGGEHAARDRRRAQRVLVDARAVVGDLDDHGRARRPARSP
jgi:hypothetical protein